MATKAVTYRLPEELVQQLKAFAETRGLSDTTVVNLALRAYINDKERINMTRTRDEQRMTKVALYIRDYNEEIRQLTKEQWKKINDTDGFSFDIQYDDADYVDRDNEWHRVTGWNFTDEEFEKIWKLATR